MSDYPDGPIDRLDKQAEEICNKMADDAKKAKIPDELFRRVMLEESIEMANRMRKRLNIP